MRLQTQNGELDKRTNELVEERHHPTPELKQHVSW